MTFRSPNRRPLAAFVAATSLLSLTLAGSALAQSGEAMELEEEEGTGIDLGEDDEAEEAALVEAEESEFPQEEFPDEGGATPEDEAEKHRKGDTQLLLGARYRLMITPKWLMNMFGVDGGKTLVLNGIGGEVGGYWGKERNGVSVYGSVTYIGYGMSPTPFKGKNDPASDWEIIESNLGAVYLVGDFLWDYKLVDKLSLNLGFSAGVGIVTGKLYRNEAYVTTPGNGDISGDDKDWPDLSYCNGPGNPNAVECPADGFYGEENPWPVYPWLNGQIGLRYQPIDELVTRFELGLGSSGFWLGLGADYAHFL